MTKWVVEGSLAHARPESGDPKFISEPFITDDGAKSFARLLNSKGYEVVVRTYGDSKDAETLTAADAVKWMNSIYN